jgi:hypothetical protein
MYVKDFGFEREREILEEGTEKVLKSGIKVTDENQPPAKRNKPNLGSDKTVFEATNQEGNLTVEKNYEKTTGKQKSIGRLLPR